MLRSGTTSFYNADGLGSITSLSTSIGAIANTYTYDSFGNLTAPRGSLTNPFRYTAREFDAEMNLQLSRARYYDQQTGRFIQEDFLRLPDGLSSYDYALNSPTNNFDPFGLCPWQVRQRPLAGKGGNAIKNLGDPPPSHKYFYNSNTGQSIGLGFKKLPWYNPGAAVPGDWETKEKPSANPDDTKTGDVPDDVVPPAESRLPNSV